MEKIQLPPMEDSTCDFVILTSSPTDPNCCVVFISESWYCFFCRPNDEQWIKQDLNPKKDPKLEYMIQSVVCCKGKIYMSFAYGIAILDVGDTCATMKIIEREYPMFSIPGAIPFRLYLVEYCGEVFLVVKIYLAIYEKEVQTLDVFKLDFTRMDWVKVESLGETVFLLGNNYTSSVSAVELGLKGDCIYFSEHKDRSLYRYSMYNQTISVILPCPNVVRKWSKPYWLVPCPCSPVKQGMVELEKAKKNEVKGEERAKKDILGEILVSSLSHLKLDLKGDERPWEDIPRDILEMIAAHLFLGDYIRFQLTCQAWTTIAAPLRSPPPPFQSSFQKSPWLMFFPNNNNGMCKFFHPMYTHICLMDFPELVGAVIRHSKYGWLLMSRGHTSLFFFNPSTRGVIKLPDLDTLRYGVVSISFSSPPTSSDCIVFAHEDSHPKFVEIIFCHLGEDSWTSYRIYGKVPFISSCCNPIFYKGIFYCLSRDGKLGVFDPKELEEERAWNVLPKLIGPNFTIRKSFIAECDGELLSIFVGHLGSPICIFRLDWSAMKWVKLESLGNRMLFVSHTTSQLVQSSIKGMENKVYFPRFYENNIVFYSLSTGKYHSFGGNYFRDNWCDTEEQWYCTWIEPNVNIPDEEFS